ncbi:MAG: GTP 3',8-cyclase MoaA [Aeromicrobium sp.]
MIAVPVAVDRLARPLRDLRISVTDRCNFRCGYCMPAGAGGCDRTLVARSALLSFEQITRLARVFADLGVTKIRLTGGEPLLRRDLPTLVAALSQIDGLGDLALTTNGSLLAPLAARLADAGLGRVTVSLDSLDDDVFRQMNGVGFPVGRVLHGIREARSCGLTPVKINAVIQRGVNEASVLPLARFARNEGLVLRLIEYMDVGQSNDWKRDDVVPADELLAVVDAAFPIAPVSDPDVGRVAERYRYRDGAGEIGVIGAVTRPFCGGCTRARLTADGQMYSCLFADRGHDLRAHLERGASDAELRATIGALWKTRDDRYSELRTAAGPRRRNVEMYRVGG